MTERISASPYPGLRPFSPAESDIFFGREAQTDRLLEQLARHRFLAIVGASGCGKSSLVGAGLVTAVRLGLTASAGTHWRVAQMRPGADAFANLAQALAADNGLGAAVAATIDVPAMLARGPTGLVDVLRASDWPADTQLLLVVDAFDDIFRVRQPGTANGYAAFVEMLLRSTTQTGVTVHVVVTLRTDFLGRCVLYPGLSEAIVDAQFLVPRLTREQCSIAICAPARVFNAEVEPALLHRLLDDFGGGADELPLLQHGLARLWSCISDGSLAGIDSIADPAPRALTLAAFEKFGGLGRMLGEHAEDALRKLSQEEQRIAQVMLRRLTQRGDGVLPDIRVPAKLSDIAAVAQVPVSAVTPVAEAFRRVDRCFVSPPADEPLHDDSTLDIAHEALLHHWPTLVGWVEEEGTAAARFRRLKETASLWSRGEAGLWAGPDLDSALVWQRVVQPTAAWASRYGSSEDFELAQRFLRASEAERDQLRDQRVQGVPQGEAAHVDDGQGGEEAQTSWLPRAVPHPARLRPRSLGIGVAVAVAIVAAGVFALQKRDTATADAVAGGIPQTTVGLQAAAGLAAVADDKVITATATFPATTARNAADLPRRIAAGRALVTAANDALAVDPELSALLALEARDLVGASGTGESPGVAALSLAALSRSVAVMYGTDVAQGPAKSAYIAALSPDGKWLATADYAHVIHVWGKDDGKVRATLRGHSNWIGGLAFSPDGKRLVSASSWDSVPRVWPLDVADAKPLQLAGHRDGVLAAAFTADGGKVLTASLDGTVRTFDSGTGKSAVVMSLSGRSPRSVALSADGRWLAEAANERTVRLRAVGAKRGGRDLGPVADGIASVTFDDAGDYVFALGREGSLHAWSIRTGRLASVLQGDTGRLQAVALRQDARLLVTAGGDNAANLYDAQTGRRLVVLAGHQSPLLATRFVESGPAGAPESSIVTVSADGTARTWRVPTLDSGAPASALQARKGDLPLEIALFNPDASLLATAGTGATRLQVFDVAMGKSLWPAQRTPHDHRQPLTNFAFSADGHWLVTTSHDGIVKIWDARSGYHVADLAGHRGSVNGAAFSPDAREVVSAGADGTARVWVIATRKARLTLTGATGPLREAAFGSDGKLIVTGSTVGVPQLWRADNGAPVTELHGHVGGINQVAWQPGGSRLLTAGKDETIRFWDASGRLSGTARMGPGKALHVNFSPDGAWIVAAFTDGSVRVGKVDQGLLVARLPVHTTWVNDAAFLPGGRTIRTIGGDGVVRDIACVVCVSERELMELARSKLARVRREFTEEERFRYQLAPPIVSAPRPGMVSEAPR